MPSWLPTETAAPLQRSCLTAARMPSGRAMAMASRKPSSVKGARHAHTVPDLRKYGRPADEGVAEIEASEIGHEGHELDAERLVGADFRPRAAICSSVAPTPTSAAAGSPGSSLSSTNSTTAAARRESSRIARRRRR